MYRDDTCAVCGCSLPPDHLYCREHAAEIDARLREIGALLPQLTAGVRRLAALLDEVATETWDYVAEQEPDDPVWPPTPPVRIRADVDEIEVDVDSEPGLVRVELGIGLAALSAALADGLEHPELQRFAEACAAIEGAGATHQR